MINLYRKIALLEATSYLFLLFIAMPFKYILEIPELVKHFGWIHGVLAIVYVVILIIAAIQYKWSIWRVILYFTASVLPVIPFILDKKLKKEYPNN
ncbi:DUF3817 domain-containing protein [Amniculibacterium sp. G2-70]|uniref:DUF3817 domain-containing protein n=1 Tax=Amniculibacterium sp. G2-70 TaxID=2767188 RepID=UPI00165400E2|nr:DUF3817 domain-containing protein [Amniculibacterium sp. G2-70]